MERQLIRSRPYATMSTALRGQSADSQSAMMSRFLRTVGLCITTIVAVSGCSGAGGSDDSTMEPDTSLGHLSAPGTDWDDVAIDASAVRAQYLQEFAELLNIEDPPDVEVVREVSVTEFGATLAQCLTEAGYPVKESGGGVRLDGTISDSSAYNLASYVCMAQYPGDPRAASGLPRVRAEMQYEYLVNVATPCMEDLGFAVADPPSLQAWLDGYYGLTAEDWTPFEAVTGNADAADAVYRTCPPDAPNLYP